MAIDWKAIKEQRKKEAAGYSAATSNAAQSTIDWAGIKAQRQEEAQSAQQLYDINHRNVLALRGQVTPAQPTTVNARQVALNRLLTLRGGAKRREKDTTAYDIAILRLQGKNDEADQLAKAYARVADYQAKRNDTTENLQKKIDQPLDLDNVQDVVRGLGYGPDTGEAARWFVKYRSGAIWHDEENEKKYQTILKTIEQNRATAEKVKSQYNAEQTALTGADGKSYNYQDLIATRAAEIRNEDIGVSQDEAKKRLSEVNKGNYNALSSQAVSGDALRQEGWDVSGDTINFSKAYSDDSDRAAVFSPVVFDAAGSVQRVLSPDELDQYAKAVLAGGDDSLNLRISDIYQGLYAPSLAQENADRVRRLSERYYNNTDLVGLASEAMQGDLRYLGTESERNTVENAQKQLGEYGVNYDEYSAYQKRLRDQEKYHRMAQEYADWSAQNVGTGTAATLLNIASSPLKALEYAGNLFGNLIDNYKAGDNMLSAYRLPDTYDDVVTNLTSGSTEAITEGIRDSIRGDGNSDVLNALGDLAANTYGGVTSAVQSYLTILACKAILPPGVFEGVGLTIIGTEAANNTYHDVIDNGGTISQATVFSAIAGFNEILTEKISLDRILSIEGVVGKGSIKNIIKETLIQSFVEGSEEVASEFLDELADRIVNVDRSQYERTVRKYMEDGLSEEAAKKQADADFLSQVGWAFYGGAIGGSLGGFGKATYATAKAGVNAVKERAETGAYVNANATNISEAGGADFVMESAQAILDNPEATGKDKLQKAVNKAKSLDVEDKGYDKAIAMVSAEVDKFQRRELADSPTQALNTAIREKITELAPQGTDISSIAEITRKRLLSEPLTSAERKVYSSVQDTVDQVVADLRSDTSREKIMQNAINLAQQNSMKIQETRVKSGVVKPDTAYNDTFSVTDTGEDMVNDRPVNVQKFTDISADDMTVQLDDGTEVKASDISWGDSNLPAVFGSVLRLQKTYGVSFTPEFVNTVYQAYQTEKRARSIQGKSFRGDVFSWGVEKAFDDGYIGQEYTGDILSADVAKTITDKAHQMREENSAKTDAQLQQEENKKQGKRKGSVTAEDSIATNKDGSIDKSKLNPKQKVGVEVIERLADSLGIQFHLFRSKNVNGKWISQYSEKGKHSPNGFYKDGVIYVDINAGNNGEGLILFTVSHELVHYMRDGSKRSFNRLADFLVQNYGTHGRTIQDYIEIERRNGELSRDVAYEEAVARLCESFLADVHLSEKAEQLYRTNRSLCEKIVDFLRDIGQKIRDAFIGVKPQSELGRIGAEIAQKHNEVLDLFIEGIHNASENLAYTENTTGKGGAKQHSRYSYEGFVSKPDMVIVSIDDSIAHSRTDTVTQAKNNAKAFGYSDDSGNPFVLVKDTGTYVKLGTDGLRHSLNRSKGFIYPVTENIGEILSNSIRLNELVPKDINAKSTYILIGTAQNETGDLYLVRSIINSYDNELASFDVLYAVNTKKELAANKSPRYANNSLSVTNSTISISDLLDYVNRYYPQLLPEDVLKHYGYDARPEGDLGDSALYQKRDADYLSAVERGDMATAQRMVDEDVKGSGLNTEQKDIRYDDSRNMDIFDEDDLFGVEYDTDEIQDVFARHYLTHSEAIGEVLRNTADIEIAPNMFKNIVGRVLKENLGNVDAKTKKDLAVRIQLELENAKNADPENIVDNMIAAVRKVVPDIKVEDERVTAQIAALKDYFSGRYYLTDDQLADLKANDETLGSFRRKMMGKVDVINKDTAKKSITGQVQNASELSLEGIHDFVDAEEIFNISRSQWDEFSYHVPVMLMQAFDDLERRREVLLSKMASGEELDNIAVNLAAKITGAAVQEKYNSRKNPYVSELVDRFEQRKREAIKKRNQYYAEKMRELRAKRDEKFAEQKRKSEDRRKEYVENRAKSAIKRSISALIGDLDKLLLRSSGDKTVKQEIRKSAFGLLQVSRMLFPAVRTVEEMATQGVEMASPSEKRLLELYASLLTQRDQKDVTPEKREKINKQLASLRNNGLKELIKRERDLFNEAQQQSKEINVKNIITEIVDSYRQIANASEAYLRDSYDPELAELLNSLKDELGNKKAEDMSYTELEDFHRVMTMMLTTIRNANRLFNQAIRGTVESCGQDIIREIKSIRNVKEAKDVIATTLSRLGVNIFKPIYACRYIGSKTFEDLFWGLQSGECTFAVDITEAKEFKDLTEEKYGYKSFDFNKKLQYTSTNGKSFELDLNQRMALFATARRPQGLQHLINEGFTFEKGEKASAMKRTTGSLAYPLSNETVNKIINDLSVAEKQFTIEMQSYLSLVMGEKGNEVSMKLYGVKLFNEDSYWALQSNENFIPKDETDSKGQFKLKNSGFTKAVNRKATNPIVLRGFEEAWSSHVYDMSMYHSMTLPLEDINKVFNYRTRGEANSEGVKSVIQGAYSSSIVSYINDLIKDVNGGAVQKTRTGLVDNLISLEKKGAVLANLSVVVQQVSSLFRAMAYINPKYFAFPTGHTLINSVWFKRHIREWNDLKKYAPVAILKEMGSFDTGTGRGVINFLSSGRRDSLVKRGYNWVEDKLSWAPQVADEIAWVQIWNAVQRETKAKFGYKLGSEENKIKSGQRFNEVIHLTQVYDSTLSRSGNMRSKQTMDKMLTSYMSEPLTYANMAFDAVIQAKRSGGFWKGTGKIAGTFGALAAAIVANALLHSIPVAMRDDDEDETFLEKYLQGFWDDIKDGINPLNYLPVTKDIWQIIDSKIQGYYGRKIERMDMSLITKAINTVFDFYEKAKGSELSGNDIIDLIGAGLSFVGMPLNNIVRDIRSVINTYSVLMNSGNTKLKDEMGLSIPWKYQQAYDKAYIEGYSEKECEKKAAEAVRRYITTEIKPIYLEALEAKDYDKAKDLRSYMYRSGYYKKDGVKSLSAVDKVIDEWKKAKKEEDERAKVAEERKKNN